MTKVKESSSNRMNRNSLSDCNVTNITERMLTLQLRELERDGVITRTVFPEIPPRVEYELTDIGKELIPVCLMLHGWGAKHKLMHLGEESIGTVLTGNS